MNASDQIKVNQILQLREAIGKLYSAQNNLYGLNFGSLSQAGSNRWFGTHHNDFIIRHDQGTQNFIVARTLIDDMIQEYQLKISSIAASIEDPATRIAYGF